MLAVRFYPMQPKCVQKCREALTEIKSEKKEESSANARSLHVPTTRNPYSEYVRTSMTHRMPTVALNHITKTNKSISVSTTPSAPSQGSSVISQSTSESCACASESAQRRRYDAVCEMQPRQNSIV